MSTEPTARPPTGWRCAVESLLILLAGGAITLLIRYCLARCFSVTPASRLVEPGLCRQLNLGHFPWIDCVAVVLGLVGLPLAYEVALRRVGLRDIGFRLGGKGAYSLGGAVALGLLIWLWALAISSVLGLRPPRLFGPANVSLLLLTWLVLAFSEEVFFRGILQRRLTQAVGAPTAIVAVSLVFVFPAHLRADPLTGLLVRLPASLLLGWLYQRSGSLLPAVLAHWLYNVLISLGH